VLVFIPHRTGIVIDLIKDRAALDVITKEILKILLLSIAVTFLRFSWRAFLLSGSTFLSNDLVKRLYVKITKLGSNFISKNKVGELMSYFTNDIEVIYQASGPGVMMIIDFIVMTVLVLYKMSISTNIVLTLIAFIPFPVIAIGSLVLSKRIHNLYMDKQDAFSKLSDFMQEVISGIRIVKSYGQFSGIQKEFRKYNDKNIKTNYQVMYTDSFYLPIIEIIIGLSFILSILYGGKLLVSKEITIGTFVAFYEYIGFLVWPMMALGWSFNLISKGGASLKRILNLFSEKPLIADSSDCIDTIPENSDIEFRNLNYSFDDKFSLNGINLKIPFGKTVAITGKTGSGKTTLINLLVRNINPESNTIFIGGNEIYDYKLETLRTIIKVVPQDIFIFSDTINNNIKLHNDFHDEDVMKSVKISKFYDNIMEFENKFETLIGEMGVNLSGGQKQRLTISRSVIWASPVVVLDDSFSSIDSGTELELIKSIVEERKGKTNIIISHKISTIIKSDLIVVMDNGKIVETGTHDELLQNKGYYKELYDIQKYERDLE